MVEGNFKETEIGEIPLDWTYDQLNNLTTKIVTGSTPPSKVRKYVEDGTNFIRSSNVFDFYLDKNHIIKINKESITFLKNSEVKAGDVLLNITGDGITFLRDCVVTSDVLPAYTNQSIAIIRPNEKLDGRYLSYYLTLSHMKKYMENFNAGSARRTLAAKHVREFLISFPSINEQNKISNFISSINEKIDINKKMNQTLEEIGQAIFKHWFVHFEFPNEEGKPYKSSGGKMVDSELGEIPVGWNIVNLNSVCDITSSKRIYHKEYVEVGIPFYRSKEIILLSKNQQVDDPLYISEERYEEISSKFGAPIKGDLLMTSVGTLGVPYIIKSPKKFYFKDGNLMWFKSFEKGFSNIYLYYWIKSPMGQHRLDEISIGSTQRALTIDAMKRMKFVLPLNENDNEVLRKFSSVTKSIFAQINVLNEENKNLGRLRDSLLPKLMSGKIRVPLEGK